jgi:ABC-type antimicrobial peptide transport system ATPase subunit
MMTGFEQVRSVVAAIAGDMAAADRVELELPETGVCGIANGSGSGSGDSDVASACCGPGRRSGASRTAIPAVVTRTKKDCSVPAAR